MAAELIPYFGIFAVGVAAGLLNVMAGGGSAISLAVLIFMGLDAGVANGSNRIAILLQNAVGSYSFHREKLINAREGLGYSLWMVPGAIAGALLAVRFPDRLFEQLLSIVLILVAASLLIPKSAEEQETGSSRLLNPALFFTGFYGGFIQAGVGFLVMFCLRHLRQLDLVRINAMKVLLIFTYTVPVLLIFGISGKIDWPFAIALAVGNSVGAWFSVKLSVDRGERIVKVFVVVAILIMSVRLFFH